MKQIQFDHTQPTLGLVIGVTEDRAREMFKKAIPALNKMEDNGESFTQANVLEAFVGPAQSEAELVVQAIAAITFVQDKYGV